MTTHEIFMTRALELAAIAADLGEVPVGAVIVQNQQIIAEGYNRRELLHSSLEHAEMHALAIASERLGRWRLNDITMYSTLEPCLMCAGALMHSRVSLVVYGAKDPKFGAIDSLYQVGRDKRLNHLFPSINGVLEEKCADMLKSFFRKLRAQKP
jgi:tRNA(adenine34) deaminase